MTRDTFTLDGDYSLGIVQSAPHRAWFAARCSTLKADLRYTFDAAFDTFPWPQQPTPAAVVEASAAITKHRAAALAGGRTLAQQYDVLRNPCKSTLRALHERLDAAVLTAYDVDPDVALLPQLLSLNLTTARTEAAGELVTPPGPGCRLTSWAYTTP